MGNNWQKKILIIEDALMMLRILVDKFKGTGFRVFQARDKKEGLRIVLEEQLDVILVDISSLGENGLAALRKFKKDHLIRDVFIIVLSNKSYPQRMIEDFQDVAAVFFTTKYWTLDDLVKIVKAELGTAN